MTLSPAFQVIEHVEMNRAPNGLQKPAREVAHIRDVIKSLGLVGVVTDMRSGNPHRSHHRA